MKVSKKTENKGSALVEVAAPSVTGEGYVLSRMALQHVRGAAFFCAKLKIIEEENKGKEFGDFFETIMYMFNACVFLSMAGVESFLNETIEEAEMGNDLAELLQRQGDVIKRYGYLLSIQCKKKINQDRWYHSIITLNKLRNQLYHLKPEWGNERDKHKRLEDGLPKLDRSPFVLKGEPLFPEGCMTHAYARWAVRSSYYFIMDFADQAERNEHTVAVWRQCAAAIKAA
jgi:hypothetical protein